MNPCFKREVAAVIVDKNGRIAVGQNLIYNDKVFECPRDKGEGYEKCISICNQRGHAETEAIKEGIKLGLELENANLYLMGNHRICDDCSNECKKHNINVIIVNKEGK